MENPKRRVDDKSERKIQLGALDVVKRIETTCNQGVVRIAQVLSAGELTTTQMVSILTPVIRAGGNDINEKEVGQALWDGGLADGMKAIGEILSQVLTSGDDEGNDQTAEQALL